MASITPNYVDPHKGFTLSNPKEIKLKGEVPKDLLIKLQKKFNLPGSLDLPHRLPKERKEYQERDLVMWDLQRHLQGEAPQVLMEKLSILLEQELTLDEIAGISDKIINGAQECTTGMHNRINQIIADLSAPENLDEMLYQMRSDIVKRAARTFSYAPDDTHIETEFFKLAFTNGYGVKNFSPKDRVEFLKANHRDLEATDHLMATFIQNYQYSDLIAFLSQSARGLLLTHGNYEGKKLKLEEGLVRSEHNPTDLSIEERKALLNDFKQGYVLFESTIYRMDKHFNCVAYPILRNKEVIDSKFDSEVKPASGNVLYEFKAATSGLKIEEPGYSTDDQERLLNILRGKPLELAGSVADFFVLDEETMTIISDLNWPKINQLLFQKLLTEGKICLNHETITLLNHLWEEDDKSYAAEELTSLSDLDTEHLFQLLPLFNPAHHEKICSLIEAHLSRNTTREQQLSILKKTFELAIDDQTLTNKLIDKYRTQIISCWSTPTLIDLIQKKRFGHFERIALGLQNDTEPMKLLVDESGRENVIHLAAKHQVTALPYVGN